MPATCASSQSQTLRFQSSGYRLLPGAFASGIQPTFIGNLPPQLTALIRTNVNVQELTVAALMTENPEHIYHAAMLDPHTAAELDLDQIWKLVDDLRAARDLLARHFERAGIVVGLDQAAELRRARHVGAFADVDEQ